MEETTLQRAGRVARSAVEKDADGDLKGALDAYTETLTLFMQVLREETNPERKRLLREKMNEYFNRAEAIKRELYDDDVASLFPSPPPSSHNQGNCQPSAPPPPPPQNMSQQYYRPPPPQSQSYYQEPPPPPRPSKPKANNDMLYTIGEQAGNVIVAGTAKAKELNEQYHLQERLSELVATGISKAMDIDREYQIHQKVAAGAQAGAAAAVQFATNTYAVVQQKQAQQAQQQQQQQQQQTNYYY